MRNKSHCSVRINIQFVGRIFSLACANDHPVADCQRSLVSSRIAASNAISISCSCYCRHRTTRYRHSRACARSRTADTCTVSSCRYNRSTCDCHNSTRAVVAATETGCATRAASSGHIASIYYHCATGTCRTPASDSRAHASTSCDNRTAIDCYRSANTRCRAANARAIMACCSDSAAVNRYISSVLVVSTSNARAIIATSSI